MGLTEKQMEEWDAKIRKTEELKKDSQMIKKRKCEDCNCDLPNINKKHKPAIDRCKRCSSLQNTYGISTVDYYEMLVKQQGVCAICQGVEYVKDSKGRPTKEKKQLVVDHCHETLAVRGLLCNQCNSGLGMFKDRIEHLIIAINYLRRNQY
jgi:hypothetical protein